MEFDFKAVEITLNSYKTKEDKLNYLNSHLFKYKKEKAEFIASEETELTYLKKVTAKDYDKYMKEINKGNLIYFTNTNKDAEIEKKFKFINIGQLKRKLELENKLQRLEGVIIAFESLIEREKNIIIPSNDNELTTGYLVSLDIEKYVNWLLSKKSVTKEEKKKWALSLMQGREKTISNYRIVITEIYYKTKYWREPTPHVLTNFSYWRKNSFDTEKSFYDFKFEGNPLPYEEIIRQIGVKVTTTINNLYIDLIDKVLKTQVVEDYYRLAALVGIIDFLKLLHSLLPPNSRKKSNTKNNSQKPTAPVISAFCKMIHESKIELKNNNETNEKYCVRICKTYKLPYTDRVRQNYSGKNTSKHIGLVETLILPTIPKKDRDKINSYLISKNPPKQKLYA